MRNQDITNSGVCGQWWLLQAKILSLSGFVMSKDNDKFWYSLSRNECFDS